MILGSSFFRGPEVKLNCSTSLNRWIFWLRQPTRYGYFRREAAVAPVAAAGAERHVGSDEFHLAMRNLAVEAAKAMDALCQAVANRKNNSFRHILSGRSI